MESLLLSCKALSSSTTCRFIPAHVAVGTAIADRPPHRSVRAALPHTALTLDDGVEANFPFAHAAYPLGHGLPRSVSGSCRVPQRSPWFALFQGKSRMR